MRLGHVALAALGLINVVYGLAPGAGPRADLPGLLLFGGAVAMPAVCFLAAWRQPLRAFFFIPVTLLLAAVVLILFRVSP